MAQRKKSKFGGILFGPALVIVGVMVLWKNEGRFDYYKAARSTEPISSPTQAEPEMLVSYTNSMDDQLTIPGYYVEEFTGYLIVRRSAEIYAWHYDDDDDNPSWSKRWMSSVESNSRNRGIVQQLRSESFQPADYRVGDIRIESKQIEFVDAYAGIYPTSLRLKDTNQLTKQLTIDGDFKLLKGGVGDERLSYSGIPVPSTATYFGKLEGGRGVPHQAVVRDGWIDGLIQDRGVLHHLVAGPRDEALRSISRHLAFVRWIVRLAGTVACCLGFVVFLSVFTSLLFHIPLLGPIAHKGTLLVGGILGFVVSCVVIIVAHLFYHPLLLATLIAVTGGIVWWARRRGQGQQQRLRERIESKVGAKLDGEQMEKLEFASLAEVAASSGAPQENPHLKKWAKRHGWDDARIEAELETSGATATLSEQANAPEPNTSPSEKPNSESSRVDDALKRAVELALADGELTSAELRTITKIAIDAGKSPTQIRQILIDVRSSAAG